MVTEYNFHMRNRSNNLDEKNIGLVQLARKASCVWQNSTINEQLVLNIN